MKKIFGKSPLVSFFLMAFVLSWVSVIPKIAGPDLPVEPFLILGAFAGPTLSSIIVTSAVEGKAGLKKFFLRYLHWKVGVVWWLISLSGILIALNLVAAVFIGASILTEFVRNAGAILSTYLIALAAGMILGPLWEEPGWRGFALPRLQDRFGALPGSIILGSLWALWHLPGYFGGWMEAAFPALLVTCIGFSIFSSWVYNHTSGSILMMILLHSSSNAAISVGTMVLPENMSPGMENFVFSGWIPAIMSALLAGLAWIFTKGTLSQELGQRKG